MPPLTDPRILVARVQAELRKAPGQGRISRADVAALARYVQRCLRVMPFVRHAPDCRQAIREGKSVRCTCGLVAAWSGPDAGPEAGPAPEPAAGYVAPLAEDGHGRPGMDRAGRGGAGVG